MKKKQFNEIIERKYAKLRQRHTKRLVDAYWISSDAFLQAKAAMESIVDCFLIADSYSTFETVQHTESLRTSGVKKTVEFLKAPYKSGKYVRGAKLTRCEHKQAVQATLRKAAMFEIAISRKQVSEIINHFCTYKPQRTEIEDPFLSRLRKRPRWVNDLAELVMTYVQFGSDYPMGSVYSSSRTFTYVNPEKLELFVRNFSKAPASRDLILKNLSDIYLK